MCVCDNAICSFAVFSEPYQHRVQVYASVRKVCLLNVSQVSVWLGAESADTKVRSVVI